MIRLDELMVQKGLAASRKEAEALVLAGRVFSDGRRLDKAGLSVKETIAIEVAAPAIPFVSRGGLKLLHALEAFGLVVTGKTCLDLGCSTGGFTDCLLQTGARRIIAVDVGYGILDAKLRHDPRVVLKERTNARHMKRSDLGETIDLAVADLSFISLAAVIPNVQRELRVPEWICLFKPQFEVEPKFVRKGGVVTDEVAIQASLAAMKGCLAASGLQEASAPIPSPILGKRSGNTEYLIHYRVV
ncbi:MAG: TlyA family RNA methyltransferase [Deltaproteobacteria bacterium]|nr:TlyA family RNA methyltransferase [Deltaproteobacteria bacterium]MBI3293124.1 TlyA family RNA methyltransferase [Deltaproteobacteria bacterium]